MEQKEPMKLLPLGVKDYVRLRDRNYYFVDKTEYISTLENTGDFLFFTRPRRFGKSLFVTMLKEYYDILAQDRYEKEFKDTWIYKNPTPERGQYQILLFNFSRIDGDFCDLKEIFSKYCANRIDRFAEDYAAYYSKETLDKVSAEPAAQEKLNIIMDAANSAGHKVYIIVDEYDNFTNNILATKGKTEFEDITHGTGFYRAMLKIFKDTATRSLLIGVSPITLDDLSSGANNYTNITADSDFNMALGFSQDEVEAMIRYYQEYGKIIRSVESIIKEIKPWYDNYCFSKAKYGVDPMIFNSDMVLYYLSNLIKTGKSPDEMLDGNTRTDYEKMKQLINLDRWDGNRKGKLEEIMEKGYIYATIKTSFPAEKIVNPNIFPSLLFYYGMLTIGGVEDDQVKLVIPNRNVQMQYFEYLQEMKQEEYDLDTEFLKKSLRVAAKEGEWHPLLEYLAQRYKEGTSIRDSSAGEKGIQLYMTAFLSLSRLFIMQPEVEMNHGYCDIFLLGDTFHYQGVKHSYIIELKYLKTDATDAEAERQWQEAVEQVKRYGASENVQKLTAATALHLIVLQMKGAEPLRIEEV